MKKIIGQLVLVRCYYAGVWAGKLESIDEKTGKVEIGEAFRLWQWQAKDGISLSAVAQNGVVGGRIPKAVPFVFLELKDCYEFLPISEAAMQTIKEVAK